MKRNGFVVFVILFIFIFSTAVVAKETTKKIRPAPGKDAKKQEEQKKSIKPAGIKTEDIRFEDVSRVITEETGSYLSQYKEIMKEEVKPKGEFETDEAYKKRIEGESSAMNVKKIQLMESIYKKKKYFQVKDVRINLPQYNPEEQYFDIKLMTLPVLENVIYQPPEEQTNLRFVPSENGVDLYLRLKISPEKGKNLREKDKFIMGNFLFTTYLSLKSQDDLNVYCVVAFSEVEIYIKEKDSVSSVYKQSLRINTPTFPKRN
ncbi:MAG: hypothetical protein N3B13_07445 [Deltaproteobacteria bacterium]|nr:hypothetical protein [Deltaproteobacteria bacterium]